jgi:orotidine-5'-phosphate decarboxylase
MTRAQLFEQIKAKNSCLCIGLDTDLAKIPRHLLDSSDPLFEFNKQIIDATHQYCVAYKPNIAFYEAQGPKGWQSLQRTMEYIPKDIFTIADAKRGDIGNTSALYARAFFEELNFDAVTVTPYMGEDSVRPFLRDNKWVILLAHTSNSGSGDFQNMKLASGRTLYEEVILKSQRWGTPDQLMYVVGATQPEKIHSIRSLAPEHFFLVPGIGAQGGNMHIVLKNGMNKQCGLLINSARAIIYASDGEDFAKRAREEALKLQQQMQDHLSQLVHKNG